MYYITDVENGTVMRNWMKKSRSLKTQDSPVVLKMERANQCLFKKDSVSTKHLSPCTHLDGISQAPPATLDLFSIAALPGSALIRVGVCGACTTCACHSSALRSKNIEQRMPLLGKSFGNGPMG